MKKSGKKNKTAKAPTKKKAVKTSVKKKSAPPKKKSKPAAKKKSKPVAKKRSVVKKAKAVVARKKAPAAKKKATPAKVTVAKKGKAKEKFPGYPHYPAGQDIMNKKGIEKTVLNEEVSRAFAATKVSKAKVATTTPKGRKAKDGTAISQQELKFIGDDELNNDGGDDEQLKKRTWPVDMAGEDLDVPGSELDDDSEAIGEEDEENNDYSIGGDRHDDLEEDKELGQ